MTGTPGEPSELIASIARGLAPPRPTPPVSLEPRTCPLCDANDAELLFVGRDHNFGFAGEFPVVRCRRCDMVYNHPAVPPSDLGAFFGEDYAAHQVEDGHANAKVASTSSGAPANARYASPRRRRDPWDGLRPFGGCRHLDLGCGAGAYLARNQALGWTVLGVDPVLRAIEACRARGVSAQCGTVPGINLAGQCFDLITLLGAVGPLPRPRETLTALREHAARRAMLIANAFNASGLMARLAGPHWTGWDLPRESCHFTPTTLAELLARTGWRMEQLIHRRRPNIARRTARIRALSGGGWSWRALARWRTATSVMSRLAVWTRRADDICIVARPA